jgi:NAD(P)-dependent dehydrogenase (short-subunit alcohol dehydrogenase family)
MDVSVFVTGSAGGIGRETATALADQGCRVVLHARDEARAAQARDAVPKAAGVLVGDLASLAGTRALAEAAGAFDVVIHNAGVGGGVATRTLTGDGLERIFQINVVAPYLLTALMPRPRRLVYLSSGLEAQGEAVLGDPQFAARPWNGMQAYADSKMYDVALAGAVARRWPGTLANAVDPGWIRTALGGPNAPGDLAQGAETPVWLAVSDDPAATVTGRYFKSRQELPANPAATDPMVQDRLLALCAELTGVTLPA